MQEGAWSGIPDERASERASMSMPALVAGYDCRAGEYPLFDLVAAFVCESKNGWPMIHFLAPFAAYVFSQHLWLSLLGFWVWETVEILLRASKESSVGGGGPTDLGYESPAGALVYDCVQGTWGVLVAVLFVRASRVPCLLPSFGSWHLRRAPMPGSDAAMRAQMRRMASLQRFVGTSEGGNGGARGGEMRRPSSSAHARSQEVELADSRITSNGVQVSTRNKFPFALAFRTGGLPRAAVYEAHHTVFAGSYVGRALVGLAWWASSLTLVAADKSGLNLLVALFIMWVLHVGIIIYVLATTPWNAVGTQSAVREVGAQERDRAWVPVLPWSRVAVVVSFAALEGALFLAAGVPRQENVHKCLFGVQGLATLAGVCLSLRAAMQDGPPLPGIVPHGYEQGTSL